jgi:hypothetical protein
MPRECGGSTSMGDNFRVTEGDPNGCCAEILVEEE